MHGHKPVDRYQFSYELDVLAQILSLAALLIDERRQSRIDRNRFRMESVLQHLTDRLDVTFTIDDQVLHPLMIIGLEDAVPAEKLLIRLADVNDRLLRMPLAQKHIAIVLLLTRMIQETEIAAAQLKLLVADKASDSLRLFLGVTNVCQVALDTDVVLARQLQRRQQ